MCLPQRELLRFYLLFLYLQKILEVALHFPSLLPSWFCLFCILLVMSRSLFFFCLLSSKLPFSIPFLNLIFPSSACWFLSVLKIVLHKAWLLSKTGWALWIQGKDLGNCTHMCHLRKGMGWAWGKQTWKIRHSPKLVLCSSPFTDRTWF